MSAVLPSASTSVPGTAATAAASDSASPGDRVVGAIERLALSRERLRTAMLPAPSKPASPLLPSGATHLAASLLERLREIPGAAVLLDALKIWWEQHPLRTASVVAGEAARKLAAPVVERNPVALMAGAVVFGALFALTKPWRWLLRPALFAGLIPAVASRVMRQLPVDSWLKMFAAVSTRTAKQTVFDEPVRSPAPYQEPTVSNPYSPPAPPGRAAAAPASYTYGDSIHAPVP